MRVLALLLLLSCASACAGSRTLSDPTLVIETSAGRELGVSTDYGVVFLGRTAQAGDVEITAWFGDGPNVEAATIEPIGGGLYTAETEIRLPQVPMSFDDPAPGSRLLVIGRRNGAPWEQSVTVRQDPRVLGLLLSPSGSLAGAAELVGACVYWLPEGEYEQRRLVGLVSGRIRIEGEGGSREFLTAFGPHELWRLVTHRRDLLQRRRWIYREDIL